MNSLRGKTECPCCETKVKPCPFCGSPGIIYSCNMVGCSENVQCGGEVDFGHWVGTTDDGIPAVHFVVEQWNKRYALEEPSS